MPRAFIASFEIRAPSSFSDHFWKGFPFADSTPVSDPSSVRLRYGRQVSPVRQVSLPCADGCRSGSDRVGYRT